MRIPERLLPLLEQGVIEDVLRPLMSGKEADVFLVRADGINCVAKVYKEARDRSFKHRAAYTEGRKVRNSRQQRAMAKHSKYGRAEEEEAWRNAEVDAIYRLQAAGVRVPEPIAFVDGVLVMELITGPNGDPAPRLVDLELTETEAKLLFDRCLRQVVKMLCAGVVHGDLSDFNVLLGPDGPVVIDFPQAVDPAHNNNARKLLVRDVRNLQSFLARYAPNLKMKKYGEEMWALYEDNQLLPDTKLTGRHKGSDRKADTQSLLEEIEHAEFEARSRREALGLPPPRRARTPTVPTGPAPRPVGREDRGRSGGAGGSGGSPGSDRRGNDRGRDSHKSGNRPARPEQRPRRDRDRDRDRGKEEPPDMLLGSLDAFLIVEDS